MDSNAVFAILLLILGLTVLTAEIFVPSGGLLGVITFLSLIVSLIFAYRAWGTSHPNIFGVFCVMLLLLVPTVVGFGFYMLPRTSFGKKVLLEAPEADELTPHAKESGRLEKLIGRYGSALTMLNPGGLVSVDGERLHAFSDGLSVEPGMSIEIVDVRGSLVAVRPGMPPAKSDAPGDTRAEHRRDLDPADAAGSTRSHSPLDFEFPRSELPDA
jgi:membrane-bound ClpP family serine protease